MKFLLLSVPVLDLQYPPSRPAIIKSCLESAGHEAVVFDTNILLYQLAESYQRFDELSNLFEVCGVSEEWTDYTHALFDEEHVIIKTWLDHITDRIKQESPDWLGISVFSYKSHKASLLVCMTVKQMFPDLKIVIGGRGASSFPFGPDNSRFMKKLNKILGKKRLGKNFGDTLLAVDLADSFISGDGEQAVIELEEYAKTSICILYTSQSQRDY